MCVRACGRHASLRVTAHVYVYAIVGVRACVRGRACGEGYVWACECSCRHAFVHAPEFARAWAHACTYMFHFI